MCEMEIQSCQMPQSNRPKIESIIGFCLAFIFWLCSALGFFVGSICDIGIFLSVLACFILGFFGKKPYSKKTGIAEIIVACLLILCSFAELGGLELARQVTEALAAKLNIPAEGLFVIVFISGYFVAITTLIPAVLFISAGVESIKNAKIRALCEK